MACRIAALGYLAWFGGKLRDSMSSARSNRRLECGWDVKNTSTLKYVGIMLENETAHLTDAAVNPYAADSATHLWHGVRCCKRQRDQPLSLPHFPARLIQWSQTDAAFFSSFDHGVFAVERQPHQRSSPFGHWYPSELQ